MIVAASQLPPPPTTTPLLEALKAEKSAQKDKETILRNHAHYKDAGVSGASLKKEDAKKKAVAATAQVAKPSEPLTPSSKKAKKAAVTAQKTQDGQGGSTGKIQPAGAAASPAKPLPPPPSIARHRPPKESHGRTHPGKGDTPAPLSVGSGPGPSKPGPVSPAPAPTENAPTGSPPPVLAQGQGHRKHRPVVGIGRHFEAALSGVVSPAPGGERKKRDRGGEGGRGKQHREDGPPVPVVPSILQRPEVGGGSDVVIVQRPHSPKAEHGPGEGGAGAGAGAGTGRGGGRRGRGRGRGGNRGG